jgi:hypothetical protein
MARSTGRTAALLACSLIFAFVSAASGSDSSPMESTASSSAAATRAAAASSDSLLPEARTEGRSWPVNS